MKIRIFQPIVPEYRVALFEGLAVRFAGKIDLVAAEAIGDDRSYPLRAMPYDYAHPFKRVGPFLWQSGLSLKGLARGDVVVVCGDVHQLSSLWIALCAKLRRIKVVWWGHHKTATSTGLSTKIRLAMAKVLSDVMLTYTESGRRYLMAHGFKAERVFATGNTVDQEPIKAAIARYDGHDPYKGRPGLLCCSVLRAKVRLDLAIRALADERLSMVVLAVIGEGPMREEYGRVAKETGVEDRLIWVGATHDQEVMAPWFLSAKAFVYPGSVGLSILHAMSYGLPVVVHDNPEHQMPEYEIMVDGKTGLCFKEGDVRSLADKIAGLLANPSRWKEMSATAQTMAFEKYSMAKMIDNFATALTA